MEAEQEELLVQHLKGGIEVNDLFPHKFYKGFVFYEIHVRMKNKAIIVVQLQARRSDKINLLKISGVYEMSAGQKNQINTKLIHKHVILEPFKNVMFSAKADPLLLNGNFFLQ